jgi:hypothetical protein
VKCREGGIPVLVTRQALRGLQGTDHVALLSALSWRLAAYPGTIHQSLLGVAIIASATRLIAAGLGSWKCLEIRAAAPSYATRPTPRLPPNPAAD